MQSLVRGRLSRRARRKPGSRPHPLMVRFPLPRDLVVSAERPQHARAEAAIAITVLPAPVGGTRDHKHRYDPFARGFIPKIDLRPTCPWDFPIGQIGGIMGAWA
jgi:hypothetical protein